jgi:hypothetical protein
MTGRPRRRDYERLLRACFDKLEASAIANERCPQNDTFGVTSYLVGELARAGDIEVEVYADNWRVVRILTGPAAGKHTQMPSAPGPVKRRLNKDGSFGNRRIAVLKSRRREPSAPRPLSREELDL